MISLKTEGEHHLPSHAIISPFTFFFFTFLFCSSIDKIFAVVIAIALPLFGRNMKLSTLEMGTKKKRWKAKHENKISHQNQHSDDDSAF